MNEPSKTCVDRPLTIKSSVIAGIAVVLLTAMCIVGMVGCQSRGAPSASSSGTSSQASASEPGQVSEDPQSSVLEEIAPYSGNPSVAVNGGEPFFADSELNLDQLEEYSKLDELGRCGEAVALVGPETLPSAERGSIGMIKPSGWQVSEYDWIDGKYLFNRCHLIAYSLAGENDNPLNLITGTRTMNTEGMLPYEERVVSYVNSTGNHVLYRVTPVFGAENLVASGVLMEARSIEDSGAGINFCVWCYNVEPGVVIDYATGDSRAGDPKSELFSTDGASTVPPDISGGHASASSEAGGDSANELVGVSSPDQRGSLSQTETASMYILNTNTHRFHNPDCPSVADIKEKNKMEFEGTREEVVEKGYRPCGVCKP